MIVKVSYIESRIQKRNESNPSLAEQLMIEAGGSISDLSSGDAVGGGEEVKDDGNKKTSLPVCWACNGKGTAEGLFGSSECFNCEGTGFDLSEPIAIIKQQNGWLRWARETIIRQRMQLTEYAHHDARTDEQKEADAVEKFYKGAKMNRND